MQIKLPLFTLALGLLAAPQIGFSADHIDSPAAVAESAADVTDLYAWMTPDASKLNLILDVSPFAGAQSQFSDAVQYVFHVNSSAGYGMAQRETLVICEFDAASQIACWVGNSDYVQGDASAVAGITSTSGKVRAFAGLRDDPFFMEFTGFTTAVSTVIGAAPNLAFDAAGCPGVDAATSGVLVGQLQAGANGAAASNTFAGSDVLSLVLQIDKDLVDGNGSVLSVWASTNRAN